MHWSVSSRWKGICLQTSQQSSTIWDRRILGMIVVPRWYVLVTYLTWAAKFFMWYTLISIGDYPGAHLRWLHREMKFLQVFSFWMRAVPRSLVPWIGRGLHWQLPARKNKFMTTECWLECLEFHDIHTWPAGSACTLGQVNLFQWRC